MNRTPRSASRRASRQLAANEPSAPWQPYISSVAADSCDKSISSGTLDLHAKRHLVLAMRVAISGSSTSSLLAASSCRDRVDHVPLPARASRRRDFADSAPGSPVVRNCTP